MLFGLTLAAPPATRMKTCLYTQADLESEWSAFWRQELKLPPYYHRKWWELSYICQSLWSNGMLAAGKRGLGFGCGREPLPSLFAKYGASVLATDADPSHPGTQGWMQTGQHSDGQVEALWYPEICPDPAALQRIEFQFADMNAIPREFDGGFDFCWSTCALEHLGSRAKGLQFIENSLRALRPGGVAVHTTEFMLSENPEDALDNWASVFYQKNDIVAFAEALRSKGYIVAPLDFDSGSGFLDGLIDFYPPFHPDNAHRIFGKQAAHLKVNGDGLNVTCIGILVTAPGP